MRRIIAKVLHGDRDGDHVAAKAAAIERICYALDNNGESPQEYRRILHMVSNESAHLNPWPTKTEKKVAQYLESLPEPDKSVMRGRQQGLSPSQIAASMNMNPRAVVRSLARIHARLRVLG